MLGWDHDTNLLDSLGELIWLDSTVIVEIEILEGLEKNGFLILDSSGLLGQLGLKGFLETKAFTYMKLDKLHIILTELKAVSTLSD